MATVVSVLTHVHDLNADIEVPKHQVEHNESHLPAHLRKGKGYCNL